MTKLRHNKKRNTAFLYEVLTRELTKSVIEKKENIRMSILSILKEHFGKNNILSKEFELYNSLLKTKNLKSHVAEKLFFESARKYAQLNKKEIFKEQSIVISKINKNLPSGIFSNFIPNYKDLATLAQIFGDENLSVKRRVLLEQNIIDNMIETREVANKEMVPIDNIVYKSFVKKFNDSYATLLEEQRTLLTKYTSSFKDGGIEFKTYLNEELGRLKKNIELSLKMEELEKDTDMKEKTLNVLNLLESFKDTEINKKMLQQVLKVQNLVKELKADAINN